MTRNNVVSFWSESVATPCMFAKAVMMLSHGTVDTKSKTNHVCKYRLVSQLRLMMRRLLWKYPVPRLKIMSTKKKHVDTKCVHAGNSKLKLRANGNVTHSNKMRHNANTSQIMRNGWFGCKIHGSEGVASHVVCSSDRSSRSSSFVTSLTLSCMVPARSHSFLLAGVSLTERTVCAICEYLRTCCNFLVGSSLKAVPEPRTLLNGATFSSESYPLRSDLSLLAHEASDLPSFSSTSSWTLPGKSCTPRPPSSLLWSSSRDGSESPAG
mmetsp:Transcript_65295/g.199796  ORF Transcript_65295/g.199796 Transcript_65295/m.199796 type:complete len:267 (+) Transcript_65295:1579-2379(+)